MLRFASTVTRVLGEDAVEGVELDDGTRVRCSPFVTSIGYTGRPVPGLPFDEAAGVVPNTRGRVADRPGAYVVGWAKRGSSGGIGDNRVDAAETVRTLLDDAVAGRLPGPARPGGLTRTLRRACPDTVDAKGLERILQAEAARGRAAGRPAVKFATTAELLRASRGRR